MRPFDLRIRLLWKLAALATVGAVATLLVVVIVPELLIALAARSELAENGTPTSPLSSLAWRFARALPGTILVLLPVAMASGTLLGLLASRGLVRRFRQLGTAAAAWSRGELTVRVDDPSRDELGDLSRDLEKMAGQLDRLIGTRQELAAVDERHRIARELHDTVKQQVFSVSLFLASAETLIETEPDAAREKIREARAIVRQVGQDLGGLILALRPAALADQGLAAALRGLAEEWSRHTGISIEVQVKGEQALPLEVEQGLFRVAQEALANVSRHSGARKALLHLAIDKASPTHAEAQGLAVALTVEDDGDGFGVGHVDSPGLGLRGMRERMALMGGSLAIESELGQGTLIRALCQARGEPG